MASAYASNPLRTREDVSNFLKSLLTALSPYFSKDGALVSLGYTGTHFDERAAQLEGFSRPLWGLSSLLSSGDSFELTKKWVDGFENGTNPASDEFWGDMQNKDQRMVECAAIGYSLCVAKRQLWDPLSDAAKDRFALWLGGMNDKAMPDTNWLWFRVRIASFVHQPCTDGDHKVFANMGLRSVSSNYFDEKRMLADLDRLDSFYIGHGWSRDGPEGVLQLDYYSGSFAIQTLQLLYATLCSETDPNRATEYRNRAARYALDFLHYFDEDGAAVPFGRSLTYRFACGAFWAALAFSSPDSLPAPITWGVLKGLLLRHLRWWTRQPGAYSTDGILGIGYVYPNLLMAENYNSTGSPYWACKAFMPLALPDSHPFWTSAEEPFPAALRDTVTPLERPMHISCRKAGHVFLLSSGQKAAYALRHAPAKYGKFAYSSTFGYSIPSGAGTLAEHAPDSMLALADEEDGPWRVRQDTLDARFEGSVLRSLWRPWKDVEVETWLHPPTESAPGWHVRVHYIKSGRPLWTAEGGWCVHGQHAKTFRALASTSDDEEGTLEDGGIARTVSSVGVSGILDLSPSTAPRRAGECLRTDANTSLVFPRATLPTLRGKHEPGEWWYVTAVFGVPVKAGGEVVWQKEWKKLVEAPATAT